MRSTSSDSGAPARGRNYVLAVLVLASTCSFLDRYVIVILQESIKREMHLSDSQLGLLTGFAFAALYVTLGLPIAHLADRKSRRNIMAISVLIWSAMTAFSGMAKSFVYLLIARIGVGVGEAGVLPTSHSMIADLFPAKQRATAISIQMAGLPAGMLIGYLFGGMLNEALGWRWTMILAGIPGLFVCALLFLTVREPLRTQAAADSPHGPTNMKTMLQSVKGLLAVAPVRATLIAASASCFAGYGIISFMPSLLVRSYGMSIAEIGTIFALIHGIGGIVGQLVVAAIADRMAVRDKRWRLWVPAIVVFLCAPAFLVGLMVHNMLVTIVGYAILATFSSTFYSPMMSALQQVVPPQSIAMTSSVMALANNVVGLGIGTLTIGVLSDVFHPMAGDESLRIAMAIAALSFPIGAFLFWRAGQKFKNVEMN